MSSHSAAHEFAALAERWSRTFDHATFQFRARVDGLHLVDSSDGVDVLVVDVSGFFADRGVDANTVADMIYDILSALQDVMSKDLGDPWPPKPPDAGDGYAMPRAEVAGPEVVGGYTFNGEWIKEIPLFSVSLEGLSTLRS